MDNNELGEMLNNVYLLHQVLTKNNPELDDFSGYRNTYNYYLTLIVLKEWGKLSLSEIGEVIGIKRQNMTYITDTLVEKELVVRLPYNEDRRVIRLDITNKGEKCLKQWQKSKIKMINKFLACFNEEEMKKFSFHLKMLNNNFNLQD